MIKPSYATSIIAAVFLTLLAPGTNSSGQEVGSASERLVAAVENAFRQPPPKLPEGVLVFPATDGSNHVRPDGWAFSLLVTFGLTYGPERRMEMCFPYVRELLGEAGIAFPEVELDDAMIERCMAGWPSKFYATTQVAENTGGLEVTVQFHDAGQTNLPPKTFTTVIPENQFGRAPGAVTKFILECRGIELSPKQLEHVLEQNVGSQADLLQLNDWVTGRKSLGEEDQVIRSFLKQYPKCLLAWEVYLNESSDALSAIDEFQRQRPPLECDRLKITCARQLRDLGRTQEAFRALLELAATHHGDVYYHTTLTKCAIQLADARLTDKCFDIWRAAGTTYADHLRRGHLLIDWAWDARGTAYASGVAAETWEKYGSRLQSAHKELESAVAVNPAGWAAHSKLITVAMGTGLPRDYVDSHFDAAIRHNPKYSPPYFAKFQYLRPRWHGSVAELIEFGEECLKTNRWNERIPQLLMEAFYDVDWIAESNEPIFAEHWELAKAYYRDVKQHGSAEDRNTTMNYYVRWGVIGKRYEDVKEEFEKLANDYNQQTGKDFIFYDRVNFFYFYDQVAAHTQTHFPAKIRAARIAINESRFDDADKILDNLKPDEIDETNQIQHSRRSIVLGRQLHQQRRFELNGLQIKYAFDQIDDDTYTVVPGEAKDRRLSWEYDPRRRALPHAVFPVAFSHGTISGVFGFTPGIDYVELSWRLRNVEAPLSLRYYSQTSALMLYEGSQKHYEQQISMQQLRFQVVIGDHLDSVKVNENISWDVRHESSAPGTFAIRVVPNAVPGGKFSIEQIQLELNE